MVIFQIQECQVNRTIVSIEGVKDQPSIGEKNKGQKRYKDTDQRQILKLQKYILRSLDPEKRAKPQYTKKMLQIEFKSLRVEKEKFSSNTSVYKGKN